VQHVLSVEQSVFTFDTFKRHVSLENDVDKAVKNAASTVPLGKAILRTCRSSV